MVLILNKNGIVIQEHSEECPIFEKTKIFLKDKTIQTLCLKIRMAEKNREDSPGGAVVKNPPANAGNTGSSPGLGRSHLPRSN